jgi:hypothetical protein
VIADGLGGAVSAATCAGERIDRPAAHATTESTIASVSPIATFC